MAMRQSANTYVDTNRELWCVIDAPFLGGPIEVQAGVLSVQGWAWSREYGAGTVSIKVHDGEKSASYACPHRYCRFDVSAAVTGIPLDNYAGFEVSIDRHDLPQNGTLSVICTFPGIEVCLEGSLIASHTGRILEVEEVHCDCCGSSDLAVMGKKDGLTIYRCENCGLAFTSPRPRFEIIRQRYSEEYFVKEYLPEMHKEGLFEERRRHWNNILEHLERFKNISRRLFEVGCGAGYLLQEARGQGWEASGIDLNPAAVTYAQSLGMTVDLGEIETYTFNDRSMGAFVLESVLEHLRYPQSVLKKCAAALHPGGGLFILTLGYEGNLVMTRGMDYEYIGPNEHLFYFSISSLCRMCQAAGLRVEHVWGDVTQDTIMLLATRRLDV